MFKSMKKRVDETVSSNDIETVIGKNTQIKGGISGSGNLRIDGDVEGGISVEGHVVIGEHGKVNGDIKAGSLAVSGRVTGNADVQGSLCIYAAGQLLGDVKVKTFTLDDGGIFKGHSEMTARSTELSAEKKNPEKKHK